MQKWEYCLLSYNSIYKERNFILYYQPGGNMVRAAYHRCCRP